MTVGSVSDDQGFRFRSGASALDLAATLKGRTSATPRDLLATPADLDRWLAAAGLAAAPPKASAADLETAQSLREAIYRLAAHASDSRLDPAACSILNRVAAATPPTPALTPDRDIIVEATARQLLAALAREAVHLFGGEDAGRIRKCESSSCSIYYVDASRSGRRRWCSMAGCGNKAKVAEHRRRVSTAASNESRTVVPR